MDDDCWDESNETATGYYFAFDDGNDQIDTSQEWSVIVPSSNKDDCEESDYSSRPISGSGDKKCFC